MKLKIGLLILIMTVSAFGQLPQTFPSNVGLFVNKSLGPGILVGGGGDIGENPPIAFLNPRNTRHIKAMVNNQGAFYTNAWIVVSGGFDGTVDSNGLITTMNYAQTGIPTMIEVLGDIPGPSILLKAAPTAGSYNLLGLDRNGNYRFALEEDGTLKFGAGRTKESMDTSIGRSKGGGVRITGLPTTGGKRFACFDEENNLVNSAVSCQ